MKIGPLPRDLDLRGLATRGVVIKGTVSLEALPRLKEAGIGLGAPAVAEFRFSRDEEARHIVEAQVEARLTLICQRCLEAMEFPLAARSLMACVWNDADAAVLPGGFEPLLVGELADLNEIAEEEILLAVPVSPVHGEHCIIVEQGLNAAESEPMMAAEPAKKSPFSVLEKLRS